MSCQIRTWPELSEKERSELAARLVNIKFDQIQKNVTKYSETKIERVKVNEKLRKAYLEATKGVP